jgi:hypothetical protein
MVKLLLFVLLLRFTPKFADALVLTSSKWRHQQLNPIFNRKMDSICRNSLANPPRTITTFLWGSSYSSDTEELIEVDKKIRALEYCLDNFGSIPVPTDENESFCELVKKYENGEEALLRDFLMVLVDQRTALLRQTDTFVELEGTIGMKNGYL